LDQVSPLLIGFFDHGDCSCGVSSGKAIPEFDQYLILDQAEEAGYTRLVNDTVSVAYDLFQDDQGIACRPPGPPGNEPQGSLVC
jgi:hypothetical protein